MKYLVLIPDGMADVSIPALDDQTPMQKAYKPCMDALATESMVGIVSNVPEGMVPESDTANMAILSFDPKVYSRGRSPLEAVSMGIEMQPNQTAFRCNLVTLSEDEEQYEDKIMIDHSADEITTEEADQLIKAIQEHFGNQDRTFYTGVSYRHCLIWNDRPDSYPFMRPHDILGQCIKEHLPVAEGGEDYYTLMKESYEVLNNHPVNQARRARGLRPANSAWLWSPGKKPSLPSFREKWGIDGAVISAVDLIKGIGLCAGMRSIDVPGATGNVHTNYAGKAQAAIDAFASGIDLVYVHVEGPDECGHRGEIENKVIAIEKIDQEILKPVYEYLIGCGDDYKILVLPDHPTPIELRTHSSDPVPFMLYDSCKKYHGVDCFDERSARETDVIVEHGHELLDMVIDKNDTVGGSGPVSRKPKQGGFASNFFDYLEIFVLSITVVLLLFTFCARLCRVDGESMKNSFENGQMLLISDLFYTPDNGDVIVFHQTEKFQKPLVKRVIATGGQQVELNFEAKTVIITDAATGERVDYSDEFATFYNRDKTECGNHIEWIDNLRSENNPLNAVRDDTTGSYVFTVPEDTLFVMGDNRNFSADSRSIGFIDQRTVLGKAIIRLKPFTVYTD